MVCLDWTSRRAIVRRVALRERRDSPSAPDLPGELSARSTSASTMRWFGPLPVTRDGSMPRRRRARRARGVALTREEREFGPFASLFIGRRSFWADHGQELAHLDHISFGLEDLRQDAVDRRFHRRYRLVGFDIDH